MWADVMAALPNIRGALCSTPQSLAEAQYWSAVPCDGAQMISCILYFSEPHASTFQTCILNTH